MESNRYKLIITIVNKGKAGKVLDIAHRAGSAGGTILLGHGAAVRLFLGISVEPEVEIVLTLIEENKAQTVLDNIVKEMDLHEPHKGIAFILPIDQVVGLAENI